MRPAPGPKSCHARVASAPRRAPNLGELASSGPRYHCGVRRISRGGFRAPLGREPGPCPVFPSPQRLAGQTGSAVFPGPPARCSTRIGTRVALGSTYPSQSCGLSPRVAECVLHRGRTALYGSVRCGRTGGRTAASEASRHGGDGPACGSSEVRTGTLSPWQSLIRVQLLRLPAIQFLSPRASQSKFKISLLSIASISSIVSYSVLHNNLYCGSYQYYPSLILYFLLL